MDKCKAKGKDDDLITVPAHAIDHLKLKWIPIFDKDGARAKGTGRTNYRAFNLQLSQCDSKFTTRCKFTLRGIFSMARSFGCP